MIALLRGKLLSLEPQRAVVEAAGVGYEVLIGLSTYAALQGMQNGREVTLHVHSHWQDGALRLYGFERPLEKRFFARLTAVNGVGPGTGLGILGVQRAEDLIAGIASGDAAMLQRAPRVGAKLAGRIVLELKDKLGDLHAEAVAAGAAPAGGFWGDVVSALVNLGYRRADAEKSVREVRAEGPFAEDGGEDFAAALRRALSRLSAK